MRSGPLSCGVNTPPASTSNNAGLPPYAPRGGFLVDEYPACPKSWLRSKGSQASYFVGVDEGTGLWLDFNDTLVRTPQHVAMVISIQGVNAITGMACEDAQLEQYVEQCPKHKKEFGPNRFCAECNFKWPKQNYLCSTGTPNGALWIDGFRAADGIIRQYVFTKQKERGVANAIIGENRVFALGISCFLSKNARPEPPTSFVRSFGGGGAKFNYCGGDEELYGSVSMDSLSTSKGIGGPTAAIYSCSVGEPIASASKGSDAFRNLQKSAPNSLKGVHTSRLAGKQNVQSYSAAINHVNVQQVEIAAGVTIDQPIHDDPNPLDFWNDKPESILIINYALIVDAQQILDGGRIDLSGSSEGFLQNVPVGQITN